MFQGLDYVPLLHARLAEVRALEALSSETKRRIFPIIRMRPWFNAIRFDRAIEVVEGAVGDGFYGFDLDDTKCDNSSERPAVKEFSKLFSPALGYDQYYEKVASGQYRVPVFRGASSQNPQAALQIKHAFEIGRGLIVRIKVSSPGAYLAIAQECLNAGLYNTAFIFDAGWRQDVLQQASITSQLVNRLLDINEDFEISVAASTFPDQFSNLGIHFTREINERKFFDQVRGLVNRGNLKYGDWGSTREPSKQGFARNRPRIDIADSQRWIFWRSNGSESYQELCGRVTSDPEWDGNLDAWGKFLIEATAQGQPGSIKSPVMAAAARVNLHLIAQAHRNDPEGFKAPDTPVGANF